LKSILSGFFILGWENTGAQYKETLLVAPKAGLRLLTIIDSRRDPEVKLKTKIFLSVFILHHLE
jgi:hypothetical protein